MFFSKKKEPLESNLYLIKIAALLIHTAKIDEKYSIKEEEIIKKTLLDLGADKLELKNIMTKAKLSEENSNQILDFTKEIKNLKDSDKIKIIKSLWKIIYSDDDADMYETNLMRRLSGLLYLDPKVVGDVKEKIKSKQ